MYTYTPSFGDCSFLPPHTPPTSKSSQRTKPCSLFFIAGSHQLSILHMGVYICQCFLNSSHSLLPQLCPHVLHLRWMWISCRDANEPRACYREWSKSEREKQISYINANMWNLEKWYSWAYLQGRYSIYCLLWVQLHKEDLSVLFTAEFPVLRIRHDT